MLPHLGLCGIASQSIILGSLMLMAALSVHSDEAKSRRSARCSGNNWTQAVLNVTDEETLHGRLSRPPHGPELTLNVLPPPAPCPRPGVPQPQGRGCSKLCSLTGLVESFVVQLSELLPRQLPRASPSPRLVAQRLRRLVIPVGQRQGPGRHDIDERIADITEALVGFGMVQGLVCTGKH